jgi:ribosomal protein L16/L10AE
MKTLKSCPKHIKYKFFFKRKIKNNFILRPFVKSLQYGSYGLMSTKNFKVTYKEMESVRVSISKKYKKLTKIWLRFKFDIPLTEKPQVRMGKGKGRINS